MVSAPLAIALLGALTSIAIAVACVATRRARTARTALRAGEVTHRESVERDRNMDAGSRLAGNVAHDLNDLLTAILGHAELLIIRLDPSSTSSQDAHEIRRAALSAARLNRALRTLSGGDRASTDLIDVNIVTARAADSLQHRLGSNIRVTLALDNDIKPIKIGASHLEEIVLGFGIHARDAMPDGGRLTVATTMHTNDERDAAPGGPSKYVRLVVADSSGGTAADAQSRLFGPSFAGEAASVGTTGLAKVHAIVKQAGGRMQVDFVAGIGTTFTIDLPAMADSAAGADPAPADTGLRASVLVVEDEPTVRELIRLVLVRAGHEVVAVAGPRAALEALNRQPAISLLLVDVVLPEMDGYDLVAEARKISPGVHVVFVSGFARDTARHPSGDGFLAKPFTAASLTTKVEEALAGP